MKNNINKFSKTLFTLTLIAGLTINVNAGVCGSKTNLSDLKEGQKIVAKVDSNGNNWTVSRIDDCKECNLDSKTQPSMHIAEGKGIKESESIGFVYQNMCTELASKTLSWCAAGAECPSSSLNNDSVIAGTNDSSITKVEGGSGGHAFNSTNGGEPVGVSGMDLKVLCQLLNDKDTIIKTQTCTWTSSGPCSDNPNKTCTSEDSCSDYCTKTGGFDCNLGKLAECKVSICHPGASCTVSEDHEHVPSAVGSTTITYCNKVEAVRVDVYNNNMYVTGKDIDGKDVTRETYCVNPSLEAPGDYSWDANFDPSKCVDSLHSKYTDANGNTKIKFDNECGYVYILSEAKRINKEAGTNVFSQAVISVAMRLFGTGITDINKNMLKDMGVNSTETNYLQQKGYYQNYIAWGLGEWVGMNEPRNPKLESGCGFVNRSSLGIPVYDWWMPEFYGYFIHTAKTYSMYLKNNVKFTNVGKTKCVAGTQSGQKCKASDDNKMYYYSTLKDGNDYIVDANYYLKYVSCNLNRTCNGEKSIRENINGVNINSCKTSELADVLDTDPYRDNNPNPNPSHSVDLSTDGSNKGQFNNINANNVNKKNQNVNYNGSYNEGANYQDDVFTRKNLGQYKDCGGQETGLGIICGQGSEISAESDYLDAIYLFIRALQGNEIKTEYDDVIKEYKPIQGETIITYDNDGNPELTFKIDPKIDYGKTEITSTGTYTVDCDVEKGINPAYCSAQIVLLDENYNPIDYYTHYDYCEKGHTCHLKIKKEAICNGEEKKNDTLHIMIVTDPNLKNRVIKKITRKNGQTLYVYDPNGAIVGGYCQQIDAVRETLKPVCHCDPSRNPNKLPDEANLYGVCKNENSSYDELYAGDPNMSSIVNACHEEERNKYDYTDDYNINGNNIVYDEELLSTQYGFQVKSDNFNVCKLFCRDESRFYLANRISVKNGRVLRYDIGQSLIDNKVIDETAGEKKNNTHNYMPSVVLQLRECTSVIHFTSDKKNKYYNQEIDNMFTDYTMKKDANGKYTYVSATNEGWLEQYKKAVSAGDTRKQMQLLYSIYNCNLYNEKDLSADIIESIHSTNKNSIESAMIEYQYSKETGKTTVKKDHGTTKDYLMKQEGCTSRGENSPLSCANYKLVGYDDSYYDKFGIGNSDVTGYEHGIVTSNLNRTLYCSGEKCYKVKAKNGGKCCVTKNADGTCAATSDYCYNPDLDVSRGKFDYRTNDKIVTTNAAGGQVVYHASGKMKLTGNNLDDIDMNYANWALASEVLKAKEQYIKDHPSATNNEINDYVNGLIKVYFKDNFANKSNALNYDISSIESQFTTVNNRKVPVNNYASFVMVTETGYYHTQNYVSSNYDGTISIRTEDNLPSGVAANNKFVGLDTQSLPLHLNKPTGDYNIEFKFNNVKTGYIRSNYFVDWDYELMQFKLHEDEKPKSFTYSCVYDLTSVTSCTPGDPTCTNGGGIKPGYRNVNPDDIFESRSGENALPENWRTENGQAAYDKITKSSENLFEPENDGDNEYSYLEYSYTLDPVGIENIREYNRSIETLNGSGLTATRGYLNNTLENCDYDENEKIFYNCNSTFLGEVDGYTGVTNNKSEWLGDGISEYTNTLCNQTAYPDGEEPLTCKYQRKSIKGSVGGAE